MDKKKQATEEEIKNRIVAAQRMYAEGKKTVEIALALSRDYGLTVNSASQWLYSNKIHFKNVTKGKHFASVMKNGVKGPKRKVKFPGGKVKIAEAKNVNLIPPEVSLRKIELGELNTQRAISDDPNWFPPKMPRCCPRCQLDLISIGIAISHQEGLI